MQTANYEKLQALESATAKVNGTSLITLCVPSGYDIQLSKRDIKRELSTASNIKSRQVRNQVLDNLNTILTHLPKTTPENGLVMLVGSINESV